MKIIDLRSDTVTHPTDSMRRAMAKADVGDDVFGEDPTVRRLEQMAAERLGKEAALFVTSGTMGNLVSLLTHCGRGDEVILGDQSHTFMYEQGGLAALGGINPRTIRNLPDGTIDVGEIEASIRPENVHFPRTRLIAVENTHNRCGGSALSAEYMREVGAVAKKHNLKVHVDGARIFNAAVAQGLKPSELAADADSITFCLSKALGAPVGSVVCGSAGFIAEARRARKVLGGGMRQAGVIAAAGIVALEEMIDRLADDHANARRLAEGLADLRGIAVEPTSAKTNIVYFTTENGRWTAQSLAESLRSENVMVLPVAARRIRAVTNYHITAEDIEQALIAFKRILN